MKNVLIIIFLGILPLNSISQTITADFYPEKDNSMFSENANNSNGIGYNIFVGKTLSNAGFQLRRGLVKFNTSTIPIDAQINSATLRMAMTRAPNNNTDTTPFNFSIHKTLQNWGEGTSNGLGSGDAAQGDDATWLYSLYSSSTLWATAGGNFVATASATVNVGFSEFPVNFGVWTSIAVKNDVESWVNTPSNNFGWIIIGDENTAGSARGFASREDIEPYRPKLTITYTLPIVDKILINEVNPSKKWIEFYNPSANPVNLANYWIVNGASSDNIGGGNVTVLNGNLLLNPGKYAVVAWTNLGQTTGEVALFNKIPTDNTAIMKDYVQYGAGSQSKATAAVTAQVWNNVTAFLQANITTNTYSLNPTENYLSGQDTNATSWLVQKQTPSYKNEICPASLTLSSSLIDASYQSSGQLNATGSVSSTSNVKLRSATAIILEDIFVINKGAIFEAKIGGCVN